MGFFPSRFRSLLPFSRRRVRLFFGWGLGLGGWAIGNCRRLGGEEEEEEERKKKRKKGECGKKKRRIKKSKKKYKWGRNWG